MDPLKTPDTRIQRRYKRRTRNGNVDKWLTFTPAQFVIATERDFEAMADADAEAWAARVDAAKAAPPYKPTREELQAEADRLVEEKAAIDARIARGDYKVAQVGKG